LKRDGVFGKEAAFPDGDIAASEGVAEGVELFLEQAADFFLDEEGVGEWGVAGDEVTEGGGVVGGGEGGVEADFAAAEAGVHVGDVLFADLEALGEEFVGGFDALLEEALGLFFEVVEQLALGLGGTELDELIVIHQEFKNVSSDPPLGVGGEADAAVGVKLFDGLEEAEVTFLDEVGEGDGGGLVFEGDFDDEAEVAVDEALLGGGGEGAGVFGGEFVLFFA
jgi:hypothetical protein